MDKKELESAHRKLKITYRPSHLLALDMAEVDAVTKLLESILNGDVVVVPREPCPSCAAEDTVVSFRCANCGRIHEIHALIAAQEKG